MSQDNTTGPRFTTKASFDMFNLRRSCRDGYVCHPTCSDLIHHKVAREDRPTRPNLFVLTDEGEVRAIEARRTRTSPPTFSLPPPLTQARTASAVLGSMPGSIMMPMPRRSLYSEKGVTWNRRSDAVIGVRTFYSEIIVTTKVEVEIHLKHTQVI